MCQDAIRQTQIVKNITNIIKILKQTLQKQKKDFKKIYTKGKHQNPLTPLKPIMNQNNETVLSLQM